MNEDDEAQAVLYCLAGVQPCPGCHEAMVQIPPIMPNAYRRVLWACMNQGCNVVFTGLDGYLLTVSD